MHEGSSEYGTAASSINVCSKKLSIVTLNANGIHNNQIHINDLIDMYDIVCVQETWHLSLEEIKKSIDREDTSVSHRNALKASKKGRASGGLAFFYGKNLKTSVQFLSDSIGILYINRLAILQVYLPYNNNESIQNTKFIDELLLLELKAEQTMSEGYIVIILGDMNIDFSKANENTNVRRVIKMLYRLKMAPADIIFEQEYDYTFWMIRNHTKITSWPDHICVDKSMDGVINTKLLGLKNNFGDHRAIGIQYEFNESDRFDNTTHKQAKKPKYDWTNVNKHEKYTAYVSEQITKLDELYDKLLINHDREVFTDLLTSALKETTNILHEAAEKFVMITRQNKKHEKRKYWWNKELALMHKEVCEAYQEYKGDNEVFYPEKRQKYLDVKKLFRLHKRLAIKLKNNKCLERLNKYFSLDRNQFWAKVNTLKKKSQRITVRITELEKHYNELLNKPFNIVPEITNDMKNKLNEFRDRTRKNTYKVTIELSEINNILDKLPNGKSVGPTGISNEHLKYCKSDALRIRLKQLYTCMINNSVVPYMLNTSIIKPIIKDYKKSADDINNQRPIAVSDVYANLLEKLLLNRIEAKHQELDVQFGFKSKSSCMHAIFILKQLMSICEDRKKKHYIVATVAT